MRNFKKKAHILTICSVAIVMLISVCTSLFIMPLQNAAAASDENTVWRKTLANAIPQCYSSTYMKDSIDGPNYYGTDSVFKKKGSFINPNGNKMDCRQVFKEANKFFGKSPTLIDLGYTMTTSAGASEARNCLWLEYYMSVNGVDDNSPRKTNQICFHIQDGAIMENPEVQSGGDAGDLSLSWSGNGWINIYNSQNPDLELTANYYGQSWEKLVSNLKSAANRLPSNYGASVEQDSSSTDVYQKYIINNGNYTAASKKALDYYTGKDSVADFKFDDEDLRYFWDQAYAKMKADGAIAEAGTCFGTEEAARNHNSGRYPYVYYNPSAPANAQWCPVRVSDNNHSYPVVASNRTSLTVSNPETILGLMTKDAWHNAADQCIAAAIARRDELSAALQNISNDVENIAQRNYLSQSLLKIRGMLANDGAGTYDKSGSGANTVVTCKALPTVDGGTDVFEPDDGSGQNPGTTPSEPDNGSGDVGSDLGSCFTSAASLGWIICPVTQMAGNVVQGIYDDIKDQFLEVKTSFVDTNSGTYEGWRRFRDFANIAFAIVLMVIILSQVTGIGVSNYGIKKTLPSLIIVAVLVNVSFFVCQLAVDISNISGDWLESFFKNLAVTGSTINVDSFGLGDLVGGLMSTLLTGAGIYAGVALAGVTWEIWLLPLLLTLLVSLIGVLFFYILLAARQAVIIILIVISPLAFICYALPNTKKMFDRWWKLFSAMLLLYPICGALMGGGVFASRLLIRVDDTNFFFKLVAVLLQVVPFFFIPTLLRNSFNALGSLGVRMANFGRNLGQRVNRSISNSEGFRDVNRRLSMNNALRGYNRIRSGRGAVNTLSRGLHRIGLNGAGNAVDAYNRRRSAQFMDSYRKGRLEDIKAEVGSYPMTEREEAALRDQIQMGQLDDLAEAYESDYRASGQADNERYMIKEHANALAALRANPEDREAKARLMGIHNILRTSDSGRTGMQNNLYAAAADMQSHEQTADAGLRYAASHMLRTDGAMYKAKNKGLHSFLLDAAQDDIKFNRSNFTHTTPDAEGNVRYNNDYYDGAKIGSWSGAALAGADEGALDRMFSSVGVMNRNSQAYQNLTTDERIRVNSDRSSLDISTREALTNPNIELQPKIRDKINMIRRQAGLAAIQPPDTTRINIPRNRRGRRRR